MAGKLAGAVAIDEVDAYCFNQQDQTDDHDFNFKLKHAQNFLKEGAKVKVEVFFRGRSIVYKDQGEIILLKFAQELMEIAKVEKLPLLEGKRMIMILAPKKVSG